MVNKTNTLWEMRKNDIHGGRKRGEWDEQSQRNIIVERTEASIV